jgi:solute carrier family 25 protein 38
MNYIPQEVLTGGISAFFGVIFLQPLDVLKTRQQETIKSSSFLSALKSTKPSQLWNGTTATLLRNVPGTALYFLTLQRTRTALNSAFPHSKTAVDLTSGSFARSSIGFLFMPLSVIKTRYESSAYAYPNMRAAFADIRKTGVRGLFAGWGATVMRDAPYSGIFFASFSHSSELLKGLVIVERG